MRDNAIGDMEFDGSMARVELAKSDKSKYDARIVILNQILVGAIEHLDEDFLLAKETLQGFAIAARHQLAPDFPELKLDLPAD